MKRPLALLAAIALLAAGCADARSGTLGPAPTAAPPAETTAAPPTKVPPLTTGTPTPRPSPGTPTSTGRPGDPAPSGTITLQLWFVSAGRIVPTQRTRPATVATSRLALTELAAGPSPAEAAAGLTTLLPTGVEVVRIVEGLAVVSPPPGFSDGGAATVRLRRAQVVYTLTQFPTVRRVAFPAGESVSRRDYADLLPAIVVTAPTIGQRVTSPVTLAGTAQVFEATVSIRILDSAGREIATAFTTASCGTGCRGDYRTAVAYRLATTQPGTVEVYEVSARDGSRINVVRIPVVVTASR
ncbi:Sporulation and spore germination [Micromonospora rhizosphaerae]|uniref:Sporulation and spore germination n=1 Tax=Micromonospora rhizosphaerae TaxID=568872 RepID=A0A1C6SUF7_9ACTN|nr:Gmad2 immunoglobulin-like domain-containing protein [Micromonospora rhizosphaerae]SCL33107.1 Sporulation and spore germination [Micromonospora rhizosphaerae]